MVKKTFVFFTVDQSALRSDSVPCSTGERMARIPRYGHMKVDKRREDPSVYDDVVEGDYRLR